MRRDGALRVNMILCCLYVCVSVLRCICAPLLSSWSFSVACAHEKKIFFFYRHKQYTTTHSVGAIGVLLFWLVRCSIILTVCARLFAHFILNRVLMVVAIGRILFVL